MAVYRKHMALYADVHVAAPYPIHNEPHQYFNRFLRTNTDNNV